MAKKVSAYYVPVDVEVVRGGAVTWRIVARNPDGTLKDMTGKTVTHRAAGANHEINKTITNFALVTEGEQTNVPCGIDHAYTEADTRVRVAIDWEDQDEDGIVFSGGKLLPKGGVNPD